MKIQAPKETTVRVTRAFCIGGEPIPKDTVIRVATSFARELISSNKAEQSNESPRAPRNTEAAPAKVAAPASGKKE